MKGDTREARSPPVDISKTKDKPYKLSDGGGLYHRLMRVSWNALLSANDT